MHVMDSCEACLSVLNHIHCLDHTVAVMAQWPIVGNQFKGVKLLTDFLFNEVKQVTKKCPLFEIMDTFLQ